MNSSLAQQRLHQHLTPTHLLRVAVVLQHLLDLVLGHVRIALGVHEALLRHQNRALPIAVDGPALQNKPGGRELVGMAFRLR